MVALRATPPSHLGDEKIIAIADYQNSTWKHIQNNTEEPIKLPPSNVLIFHTDKGSMIAARPSGTEPKIKFYISVNCPLASEEDYNKTSKSLEQKIALIIKDLNI